MKRCILVLVLFWSLPLAAQSVGSSIASITEPNEGLSIKQLSPATGHVTFASTPGRGILLSLPANASAEERAMHFARQYGAAFGVTETSEVRPMRAAEMDDVGVEHVRMQQFHHGVPIRAAELVVHLRGARVVAANGHAISRFPDDVTPRVPAGAAQTAARQLIDKYRPESAVDAEYSDPLLEILDRGLLSDGSDWPPRLAWFVEASGVLLREFIWIDAQNGAVLLRFSQFTEAKSRTIYNGSHVSTLPGTLVRSEGGAATGDADQDNAYTYAGITYDYYLTNHGRDSYNNAGAAISSTCHHCPAGYPQGSTCPTYRNAFWNGSRMVYADGFASADDVVGHELTHAVTEYSANLLYYVQSGALNESFSDIFGETIDLTDGVGNDASNVRWKIGEELPIGSIRDLMTPTLFSDPGKMSDSTYFYCNSEAWTDPTGDSGGVHINSGIPNHAFALMVDGGTYNGRTITGIGLTKAAKIQYRALTVYLTSGSGFIDDYNALNQSCTDLIGTVGITSGDCTQVASALLAVEMNANWPCSGAARTPPRCTTGVAVNVFSDNFEATTGNWTATNGSGTWGSHTTDFARGGTYSAYGTDPSATSDHRLTTTNAILIPAAGRLYFDHAFEFEDPYDGGVVEYSTNNGSTWVDAASLIRFGRTYTGTLVSGTDNPLTGRSAFVASSHGYTGTMLNLTSLAGQSVKFRFRVGSDSSIGSLGWVVDNVSVYACPAAPSFTNNPLTALSSIIRAVHVTELRTRIDTIRAAWGLTAYAWTDPSLTGVRIKAVHFTELRTALTQVYTAAGKTPPTFTTTSLTGTNVRAVQMTELRNAVIALE